ncbi:MULTISPECIES: signal peptidase I [Arthrobacter]|uniref:Signal peptidase I n=2 Tax=Arthrobacter TaxID=1663 RepID=A0ABU9KFC4_9MICC|nr:signal peptidase I [Arthrobacter sp. YJM1]MDP5225580.1 signal peptidase I [Arthrobacter sp. YJM1]
MGANHPEPEHEAGQAPEQSRRDRGKRRKKEHPLLSLLKEIGVIVGVAVLLSFLIKTFLFRAFYVPSASMEKTLEINDRIFVNRLVPNPIGLERGDVVVFRDSKEWLPSVEQTDRGPFGWVTDTLAFLGLVPDESKQYLVKRVIGLPGDHVVCCDAQDRIQVNGIGLDEPYINPDSKPIPQKFDVTVPAGKIWVMGDNRNNSADSRAHIGGPGNGFVDISDVEGRAAVIVLPINRMGVLGNYPDVFKNVPVPSKALEPDSAQRPEQLPAVLTGHSGE